MNHTQSPSQQQIIDNRKKYVDTRSEWIKFWHYITGFEVAVGTNFVFAVLVMMKPHLFYLSFFFITLVTLRCLFTKRNKTLPVKLPIELQKTYKDLNAPHPGRRSHKKALGTVMLGNVRGQQQELWQEGEDLLTHGLVIGTTGAGKTETLISLVGATAFCMGGGVFYLDPKAGNNLIIQFSLLCKLFGRIDDLRILNYKKGGVAILEEHWRKSTNTFNPFALMGAAECFQVLGMLIPSEAGANESFLASAREVMKAILPALCELRDAGIIMLTPGIISDYLNLQRVADLYYAKEKNIYVPNKTENATYNLTKKVLRPLEMYLQNLQYDPEKSAHQQSDSVTKSFGYAKGYYGEPLANLAANFGHIYDFELPEISLEDTIFNNRILVSLLPSMENPPSEQKNLGKISLSAIKQAMSLGLGGVTEGSHEDIMENIPVDMKVPFIIVADEYAEVAVPGFAVAATQGRSLGVSVLFGSQDLEGLIRADKEEAGMIFGNTLNKWLMRTQDPDTTWKKFKELASTVSVAESGSFGEADLVNRFKKEVSATIKEVDRIHFHDVVSQMQGEAHFFERGNVHKINTFYHNFKRSDVKRTGNIYNRLLPIVEPEDREIDLINGYLKSIESLETAYNTGDVYPELSPINQNSAWKSEIKPFGLFCDTLVLFESGDLETTKGEADAGDFGHEDQSVTDVALDVQTVTMTTAKPRANAPKFKVPTQQVTTNDNNRNADLSDLNTELNSTNQHVSNQEKIAETLSDEQQHWMFASGEDEESVADKLSMRLKELNKHIYGEASNKLVDEKAIDQAVKETASENPYTSKPVVKPKEDDLDAMFNHMQNLLNPSI